jgi:Tfp pilus assembly protein PilV
MDLLRSTPRGTTLIEAMIAMVIVTIGAIGTVGLHMHQLSMNAEARNVTEAAAFAKDLVENLSLWAWNDTRLGDTNTSNNSDLGDGAHAFEGSSPTIEHQNSELTVAGYPGILTRAGFERYWNVAVTGSQVQVAVIVRWQYRGAWHRIVTFTSRADTSGGTGP